MPASAPARVDSSSIVERVLLSGKSKDSSQFFWMLVAFAEMNSNVGGLIK